MKKILFIFIVFLSHNFAYAEMSDPKTIIDDKYREIEKITSSTKNRKELEIKISKVMDSFVDYDELSHQTLIKYWDELKEKQKKEFIKEFKSLIHTTYVRRFKPNTTIKITYNADTEFKGDKAMVKTTVHSGKGEVNIDYIFHKNTQWRAYDVIIDGVSMMKNYRREFHKIMKKEGFSVLISNIKKKVSKK